MLLAVPVTAFIIKILAGVFLAPPLRFGSPRPLVVNMQYLV